MQEANRYRTIWISDVHLGTKSCRADVLLDFFRHNDSETLYLVGDIFDGWALKKSWFWDQAHNDVVQKVLRKGRKGTRIVYLPGNHDEFVRQFLPFHLASIAVLDRTIHETADGKRLLVLHGDEFDGIVVNAKWLSHLGASAYAFVLKLNGPFNRLRRLLGKPYWSLSAFLKYKTKRAVQFIADFERVLAEEAHQEGADGVVCGHIHHAEMRTFDRGTLYCNCGDWVESCTALVEHFDGRLEIVRWEAEPEAPRRLLASPIERVQRLRKARTASPV